MLDILPFLTWLAPIVSEILLVVLWSVGDLRRRAAVVAGVWFLAAAYLQFFGPSSGASAAGLALQTLLAIALIVRWRSSR